MLVCLTKAGRSTLLLHRMLEKPLTAEGSLGAAAGGRHGNEPGPGKPTSPRRKVRKMSQEERNMLQGTCSCGISIQKGSVIHRTSYELLEKGPGPPPAS